MDELVMEGDFEWGLELVCCWLLLVAASFGFFALSLLISPSLSSLILSLFSFSSSVSFNLGLCLCLCLCLFLFLFLCLLNPCNVVAQWSHHSLLQ